LLLFGSLLRGIKALNEEQFTHFTTLKSQVFKSDNNNTSSLAAIAFKLSALISWPTPQKSPTLLGNSKSFDLAASIIATADWITRMSRSGSTALGIDRLLKVKDVLGAMVQAQKIENSLMDLVMTERIYVKSGTVAEVVLMAIASHMMRFSEPQTSFVIRKAWSEEDSSPAEAHQLLEGLSSRPYKIVNLCQKAVELAAAEAQKETGALGSSVDGTCTLCPHKLFPQMKLIHR
jgi:hypothetical protein